MAILGHFLEPRFVVEEVTDANRKARDRILTNAVRNAQLAAVNDFKRRALARLRAWQGQIRPDADTPRERAVRDTLTHAIEEIFRLPLLEAKPDTAGGS